MNRPSSPPKTPRSTKPAKPRTRIQIRNQKAILDAALNVFSAKGFRGATVDEIAKEAGLSKPNLLYYFPTKESIHVALLAGLLDSWLDPLRNLNPDGDPIPEILSYVSRKLEMSRDMPRESRLFANEILHGAPHLSNLLGEELKPLVDAKAEIIAGWMAQGKLAPLHPHHLIFSIWSLTQHYADFDVQVRTVLGGKDEDPFPEAERYLTTLFTKMLTP